MPKYCKEVRLCDFNEIKLTVPRYRLIKLLLKRAHLSSDEFIFLKALLWKAEAKENQILHVKSIIYKALQKSL